MDRFKDKTVIVTGAGSGIGKSTALRLDAEGAKLLVIDINEEELSTTHSMLKNQSSTFHLLNIASLNDTKKFFFSERSLTRVVFPAPEGDERIIIAPLFFKDIKN